MSGPCKAHSWTFSQSGVIQVRTSGREKHYWLKQGQWMQLLNRGEQPTPKWVTWPPLFSALERDLAAAGRAPIAQPGVDAASLRGSSNS